MPHVIHEYRIIATKVFLKSRIVTQITQSSEIF